jgi:hypothetical protein
MNKLIYILLILLIGNSPKGYEKRICWEEGNLINWKNFIGKPQYNTSFAAITTVSLRTEIISNKSVLVENCMIEKKSWVVINNKTDYLLKHEQYHFNLAEIIARRMRKDISTIKTPAISAVKKIFDERMQEFEALQQLYDEETKHSIDTLEQLKWQKKIDDELQELELYKNSTVTLLN